MRRDVMEAEWKQQKAEAEHQASLARYAEERRLTRRAPTWGTLTGRFYAPGVWGESRGHRSLVPRVVKDDKKQLWLQVAIDHPLKIDSCVIENRAHLDGFRKMYAEQCLPTRGIEIVDRVDTSGQSVRLVWPDIVASEAKAAEDCAAFKAWSDRQPPETPRIPAPPVRLELLLRDGEPLLMRDGAPRVVMPGDYLVEQKVRSGESGGNIRRVGIRTMEELEKMMKRPVPNVSIEGLTFRKEISTKSLFR